MSLYLLVLFQGYIRFGEEGGASLALAGLTPEDGNPQLCGAEVELRVLEGTC